MPVKFFSSQYTAWIIFYLALAILNQKDWFNQNKQVLQYVKKRKSDFFQKNNLAFVKTWISQSNRLDSGNKNPIK